MRKLLPLLLVLGGCDSEPEAGAGASPGNAAAANIDVQLPTLSPGELEQKVRTAMRTAISDPESAELANIRAGSAGSVCGDVNAKGDDGKPQGFRPFVVSPEGVAVVSLTPGIMFNNPADMFPDFHIRYCAASEELPALERQMAEQRGQPAEDDVNLFGLPTPGPDPAPIPEPPPPAPERAEPPPPPRPRAAPLPPPGSEDSFFNSVMRPADEKKKS